MHQILLFCITRMESITKAKVCKYGNTRFRSTVNTKHVYYQGENKNDMKCLLLDFISLKKGRCQNNKLTPNEIYIRIL